jgi:hypothetical protein
MPAGARGWLRTLERKVKRAEFDTLYSSMSIAEEIFASYSA